MPPKRPRKAPPKSASLRLLLTPDQLKAWQTAANIKNEGNLSAFVRGAMDAVSHDVIADYDKEHAS